MALTTSRTVNASLPNQRMAVFDLTFTGVTGGEVKTGFSNVLFAVYVPDTSDDHGITYLNFSDAGTTAARGSVYVDGVTSDDGGKLLVIGN